MRKLKEYNFVKFQPNPSWNGKGKYKHEDCPIRAICAATDKSWEEVYDILAVTGKQVCDAQTSDQSIEKALVDILGFQKVSIKPVKGSKRPTPASLTMENKNLRLVMRVAGHVVGGKDGKYMDCWDCGDKGIYTYYFKEA